MEIRKSTKNDLNDILNIYAYARLFMAEHNNPTQWGVNRPSIEQVVDDIAQGNSYVCIENKEIIATFYFAFGDDPTYGQIYEGKWLNSDDYAVVHRIASSGKVKGVGSYCLNWAFEMSKNLKIDTHRNNLIMQKTLEKNGFEYCGIIYLENGDERLAYQREK